MKAKKLLIVAVFALGICLGEPKPVGRNSRYPDVAGRHDHSGCPVVNYFGPGPQTFGPGITWCLHER